MCTSYFSYGNFSVNNPHHRHIDYDAVQPDSNLYHSLYFTLSIDSDVPDNNGDENDVSVETLLCDCLGSQNSKYFDFTATIAQTDSNEDSGNAYMVCLELPFLRVQEQLTHDMLVMSFIRFEDALYNVIANHRNGEDYDNDDNAFYGDMEDNDSSEKLYVNGELISAQDMHDFMLNIRDTILSDEENDITSSLSLEYFANGDEITSANIENQILKAYITWSMHETHRQHIRDLTKGKTLLAKVETDCNRQDMALVYKS